MNLDITTKVCTKCKRTLPATLEYFSPDKRRKSGLQARCKRCHNDWKREYNKSHPENVSKSSRKWQITHPQQLRNNIRKYAQRHPDKRKAHRKRNELRNPDRIRAKERIACHAHIERMGVNKIRLEVFLCLLW